jgi:ribosome-associated protein
LPASRGGPPWQTGILDRPHRHRPGRARTSEVPLEATAQSLELAHELVDVLVDRQAADVVLLDLTELSAFADYFVIATVDNIRQSRAIVDIVGEKLREHGIKMTFEGDPESGWILVDAGRGVFIHLFSLESRAYYNLEGLWSKAQEVVRIQ